MRYVRSESAYCAAETSQPYSLIVVQQTPDQIAGAAAKNERRPQCRSSSSIHWMIGASPSNLLRISVCARRQASTDAPVTEIIDATAFRTRASAAAQRPANDDPLVTKQPVALRHFRHRRAAREVLGHHPPLTLHRPEATTPTSLPCPRGASLGHHIPITGSRQPAACCTPRGTKVQIDVRINQSTEIS